MHEERRVHGMIWASGKGRSAMESKMRRDNVSSRERGNLISSHQAVGGRCTSGRLAIFTFPNRNVQDFGFRVCSCVKCRSWSASVLKSEAEVSPSCCPYGAVNTDEIVAGFDVRSWPNGSSAQDLAVCGKTSKQGSFNISLEERGHSQPNEARPGYLEQGLLLAI